MRYQFYKLNKPIYTFLLSILRSIGVDRSITFATLTSIMPLVFGPVTVLLIATRFSPELQGYYYTFGSLLTLQVLLDVGLGQAVIQFASHEWSKLSFDHAGRIVGDADALSRLISLGQLSFKWYGVSALLLVLGMGSAGFLFFSRSPTVGIQWEWPWFVLCVGAGVNFALMPIFYMLQGCNQVSQFWFYRFIQQIVNGFSLWGAILFGAKLWTMPFAAACGLVWSGFFLWRQYRAFFGSFLASQGGPQFSWRAEVWPMQWRVAISWISASFITSLFAPVLFQLSGPVAAGQMGMTVTLNQVLLAISSNWVVTKAPRFGVLIAQRKFKELDRVFSKSFWVSLAVVSGGAVAIWGSVYLLNLVRHALALRILSPLPTGLFVAATVLNSANISLAIYLRAHKREPLAKVYLVSGILILALAFILGTSQHAIGVTGGYLAIVALLQFPLSLLIFWRCRNDWHKEPVILPTVGMEPAER